MKTFNSATATIHIQNNRVTKEFYKKNAPQQTNN